jgi:hypothetical protein
MESVGAVYRIKANEGKSLVNISAQQAPMFTPGAGKRLTLAPVAKP